MSWISWNEPDSRLLPSTDSSSLIRLEQHTAHLWSEDLENLLERETSQVSRRSWDAKRSCIVDSFKGRKGKSDKLKLLKQLVIPSLRKYNNYLVWTLTLLYASLQICSSSTPCHNREHQVCCAAENNASIGFHNAELLYIKICYRGTPGWMQNIDFRNWVKTAHCRKQRGP